jgi:hypothetical protein
VHSPVRYKPGPVENVYPREVYEWVIRAIDERALSYSHVGTLLERRGIRTPNGHERWHKQSVKRLYRDALDRIETPN